MPARTVIFANGILPDLDAARRLLRNGDVIICADGGTRHALALGLRPQAVIGDLDSLTAADLAALQKIGVPVRQHPVDKNETDLELALKHAAESHSESILVVGGLGGRADQTIANLALITAPGIRDLPVRLDDGVEEAFFCRDRASIVGQAGEVVSLIPWGGAVQGVRTEGLRWPLHGEDLAAYASRGLSNELSGERAAVSVEAGLLLIVHRRQNNAGREVSTK